jgi:hypothetical protein
MRELVDDGARGAHALTRGGRQSDLLVVICDDNKLIER